MDALLKHKKLDRFLDGPVYWVDSADSQPSIGMIHIHVHVHAQSLMYIHPTKCMAPGLLYVNMPVGTASAAMWTLRAEGHQSHSSLPNKASPEFSYVN